MMHPHVHANLVCIESLLDVPATLGKPNKRWHSAFTTIYCSRTIYSLSRKPVVRKKPSKISSSPSYTTLNINLDTDHFKIHQSSLSELVKKKDLDHLENFGGIVGIAHAIGTDMDDGINGCGINGGPEDIARRQQAFGSNTYKKPPTKGFFHFVVEAFKDLTIFILLGCAALSLGFGIKEHGLKEGWYDGGSISVAVFLVIAVSAISNYRQNRQFDKLSKISDNMKIDVVRSRRRQQISEDQYEDGKEDKTLREDCLTLLGLVGIKDPCRPGVKKAVDDCQRAGVNIKMITGDNVFTARAIAIECGILKPGAENIIGAVVEGEEFRNYSHEQRMEKVDKICVMARSSPLDKLLMVKCLKQKGHVVAVTGDGTNDAPALKEADIGLSMGIQGTEVAKESSDIVILDDNFASVATVLRWGRCVYNNIQKFIQFQLTVNVAALVINFVAAVSAGEVPLTAVQLLWVNLIMDTLGALALATEQPTQKLMEKRPVGRTEPLITNIMWRNLLSQALYQITILLTLQFKGESIFGVTKTVNDTLIFNIFVLCQVFNEFNARKLEEKNVFRGIHKNRLFLGIIGITILLQVLMVEFLKKFADTERLNWGQWGGCVGTAALSWPIGWVVKCIPVPEKPIFSYLAWRKYTVKDT